jgi:hypothetical protein
MRRSLQGLTLSIQRASDRWEDEQAEALTQMEEGPFAHFQPHTMYEPQDLEPLPEAELE